MALELLPDGTFKKLTKVQTDALDRYYKRDKKVIKEFPTEAGLLIVGYGVPIVMATTIITAGWIFRDEIKEKIKEAVIPSGLGVAKWITRFVRGEKNVPTEPQQPEVTPQGNVLSKCQRYEADYATQNTIAEEIPFGVGTILQALAQLNTIQSMKLEGCSKPDVIPQAQWDQG
jgi:hypothetical protein